jgi:hypothetical protein
MTRYVNILTLLVLVLVTFRWEPNAEPDITQYVIYQVYQGVRLEIARVNHPTTTVSVDVPRIIVANGYFVARAVDTEGYDSEDSAQARCDYQECIDKYLLPGQTTGIGLEPDPSP